MSERKVTATLLLLYFLLVLNMEYRLMQILYLMFASFRILIMSRHYVHSQGMIVLFQEYVMKNGDGRRFLDKLEDLMQFLIPRYLDEGKNSLVIGIGCTGGKHRSVTITNGLYARLKKLPYTVRMEHRDIEKDARTKGK